MSESRFIRFKPNDAGIRRWLRRRLLPLVAVALAMPCLPRLSEAQLFGTPELRFEPGMITRDAVSAPGVRDASTGLLFRVMTMVPTAWRHLDLQVGTAFAPIGLSNGRSVENDVAFYYGVKLVPLRTSQTDGWLELGIPVLGYFHLAEREDARRFFVNDLVVQTSARLALGPRLMSDMGGVWSRLTLYVVAEQNLSPPPDESGRRDRFRPVFHYGLSIPIGHSSSDR
ncbi:MAG TPA: hypothetical protein VFG84_03255 [Gemmatimonadaceae bacterium]|nr:hypothetical protein [Gemmatimonadaceae bacterium]